MIRAELSNIVRKAFLEADRGGRFAIPEGLLINWDKALTRPRAEHGDFACDLPLKLGSALKTSPLIIAEAVMDYFSADDQRLAVVEVARPGFINFTVANIWLSQVPAAIIRSGAGYGFAGRDELELKEIFFPITADESFNLTHCLVSLAQIINAFQSPAYSEDGGSCQAYIQPGEFAQFLERVKTEADPGPEFLPLFVDQSPIVRDLIMTLAAFPEHLSPAHDQTSVERQIYEYCLHLADLSRTFLRAGVLYCEQLSVLKARLGLIFAVRQVFLNGLGIIGLSAQERV